MIGKMSAEDTLKKLLTLLCSAKTLDGNPMAACAQLLPQFFIDSIPGSSDSSNLQATACFPSLSLHDSTDGSNNSLAHPANGRIKLEDLAVVNLGVPFHCSPQFVSCAPETMLSNLSISFMSLIESRLRSTISALLKQSMNCVNGNHEDDMLLKLLCSKDSICISTVVTSFHAMGGKNDIDAVGNSSRHTCFLPLVFEAIVDVALFGSELATVTLRSSGTILASLTSDTNKISELVLSLDSKALLQSLMKEARFVVRKAVLLASKLSAHLRNTALINNISSTSSLNSFVQQNRNVGLRSSNIVSRDSIAENSMPPPPPRKPSSASLTRRSINDENSHKDKTENVKFSKSTNTSTVNASKKVSNSCSLLSLSRPSRTNLKREIVENNEKPQSSLSSFPLKKRRVTSCPSLY